MEIAPPLPRRFRARHPARCASRRRCVCPLASGSTCNPAEAEGNTHESTPICRRNAVLSLTLVPSLALSLTVANGSKAGEQPAGTYVERKPALASTELTSSVPLDTSITNRVFFDIRLCPTAVRLERTLGDMSFICKDGEQLGRIVIGLYGHVAPTTVQHFLDMVSGRAGSTYKGTTFHKSLPGQYISAGKQGAVEKGEAAAPTRLGPNKDAVDPLAFSLSHLRPGTVSLCLGENDDDDETKQLSDYRNVQFMITTGAVRTCTIQVNRICLVGVSGMSHSSSRACGFTHDSLLVCMSVPPHNVGGTAMLSLFPSLICNHLDCPPFVFTAPAHSSSSHSSSLPSLRRLRSRPRHSAGWQQHCVWHRA